jgi:peptidyl-prolyl cis-trans isomerase SurA
MTFSAPKFRVLLAGFVLSTLPVLTPALSAQATKPATSQGTTQAPASPFNGEVVEESVAQVNDQIITLSDYRRAEQQMEGDAQQQGWSAQELEEQKRDLLRDLIDKELLLSKGKELNITGETELVKSLDEIRKQNHLDSMEDLEKAAQEQGVSYEDFKQKIRNEIIIKEVTRDEVARHIQLTKAEVEAFYRAHQAEFAQPEAVHLGEILIPVEGDDDAALAAAQQKAADAEAKLKSGANFDDLAKQVSSGPTASTGGDLGDFKRGALAKPIEDATFSLKAGQVTQPIRTKQGLLILKVTQHTGGSSQDFASIEPQVEEAVFMTRMQPELRKYLTTLRTQAYIDIRTGYEDTGKAGNSIKPLFTAYTPPGKKKVKKKVQRTRFREAGHTFRNKTSQPATATASSTPATPPPAATTTPATTATAASDAAPVTAKPAQVAANTTSSKPVKKQKVRYGQAPTGTLDNAPENTSPAAPDAAGGETQVASNVSSNITGPGIATTQTASVKKTRYSARAHESKKVKGATQDQLENESQGTATPEEQATQQTQSAPLGLQGDTATKKKQPKTKSDQKTRYADKPKDDTQSSGTPSDGSTQPSSNVTPPATAPAQQPAPDATPPPQSAPQ